MNREEELTDILRKVEWGQLDSAVAFDRILRLFSATGSVADAVGRNCPFCGEPCVECSHKAIGRERRCNIAANTKLCDDPRYEDCSSSGC